MTYFWFVQTEGVKVINVQGKSKFIKNNGQLIIDEKCINTNVINHSLIIFDNYKKMFLSNNYNNI